MGIAGVIATIAKADVPSGKWNELLQYLLEGTRNPVASHREVCHIFSLSFI